MGLLSTQGRGTTLHVALPIAALPATAAAAASRAASTSTRAPSVAPAAPFTACSTRRLLGWCEQVAAGRRSEGAGRRGSGREMQVAGVKAGGLTRHTRAMAAQGGGEVQGGEVGAKWVSGTGRSAKEDLKEALQGMEILVVDDNLVNRRVAASTLARYGAEVALAESGEAALRLLQARHSFRLVLMDLLMPGLDGYETVTRLRGMERESGDGGAGGERHVRVVAMSADVDSAVAARAALVGMDGAVQKPLESQLLSIIRTLQLKCISS
ncbi:unnamed protein product [Closterium sp. Naga37s-1]|nr:unnamed protein product [Closterium sp. Naga37s-1]